MKNESKVIFDVTNPNCIYKGILFAELDFQEMDKQIKCPVPILKDYVAGVMALIWIDEKGIWNAKLRIKFPSGNKQVCHKTYQDEFDKKINVNETYVLNDLYRFPLKNKKWMKNSNGTPEGILKLLKESDMIESLKIIDDNYFGVKNK